MSLARHARPCTTVTGYRTQHPEEAHHDQHPCRRGRPHVHGRRGCRGQGPDYSPASLNNMADDVTIEGSLLDGAALGPDGVRTIVGAIRTLYEDQQFKFA